MPEDNINEPAVVTKALRALRYDGTNSARLAEKIDDFTVVTEDASNLTFTSGGQQLVVPRGGYVVYHRGVVAPEDVFANEDDYLDAYAPVAVPRDADQHVHQVILTSGPAMHVSGTAGPLGLD